MAKIVALNRKHLTISLGLVLVCLMSIAVVSLWKNNFAPASRAIVPDIKMLSVSVEPSYPAKDVSYGSVTLKGSQIIPAKVFDFMVTIQNTTVQKMTNIPVELEVSLVGSAQQKVTKLANVATLDPGATAKVIFHQVHALGDAQGKDPTAGLHQITVRIKANPAGGVSVPSQANFRFNVDSAVKVPVSK